MHVRTAGRSGAKVARDHLPAAPAPAPQAVAAPPGYVWATACKDCHKDIYASWENTKHARALNRLDKDEQQKECIGCHATGSKALIDACKPHRYLKEFPQSTMVRRDVYERVARRWNELGFPGPAPRLPALHEPE